MKKNRIYVILAAVLLLGLVWLLWGNLTVGLTKVTVTEENLPMAFHGYRIAHVSDLHNSHLWKQTLKQLQKAKPDIICITGDLVDSNRTDVDVALSFAAEAVKIAPCYYVPGNHEGRLEDAVYARLTEGMSALGVTVLQDREVVLTRGDQQIGLAGLGWTPGKVSEISQFAGYRVLLAHHPEHIELYKSAGFDLVLSGHVHGGQFRLPFVGGLLAPGQGWFPYYDGGLYREGVTDLYISRGIGNSTFPLRLNNRPEVILIRLVCE